MRIDANQKIAGFPAVNIRRLMRETVSGEISLRRVQASLNCSTAVAKKVLADLQREGLIESVAGHRELSLKGSALAQATAAKPLIRHRAERLISELVERAKLINADDAWAYRIEVLVVFGSFVAGAERPNDVDVGCKVRPRWRGERQAEAEQRRRKLYRGQFRNTVHCLYWPRLEIFKFLKARSRGLSIQELSDWILKQEPQKIVFRDRLRQ
jgi:hypothetical protein